MANNLRYPLWATSMLIVFLATSSIFGTGGANREQVTGEAIIDPMNNRQFDQITYQYWDAPMPGFVSYEIQTTADSVRLKISSFHGNSEISLAFDSDRFDRLLAAFEYHGIGNCDRDVPREGCAGGTTDSIACQLNGETVFSGKVYHCAGGDSGNLCGDIGAFVEEFKNLAPEIDRELRKHGAGS